MKEWKCTVCGYIHKGDRPPGKCPVCGANEDKFIEVPGTSTSAKAPSPTSPKPNTPESAEHLPPRGRQSDRTSPRQSTPMPWLQYPEVLTRLHGHPMSVHIPNGVLPVSVLFMLLSIWFESATMAAAAKYNLFFVTLAMPAVIVTGLGDWINRYKGRMTKVFRTKMICAGIVTTMCLTLSVWWLVQPEIYVGNVARLGTFVIFHLIALAAAIVAGWYGGKLVFPKK